MVTRRFSSLRLNNHGPYSETLEPIRVDLKPGLYRIDVAFGCWSRQQAAGPGRLTVMIAHPDEPGLVPVRPDELLRPVDPDNHPD